jgi:hypothetical protein
MNSFLHGKKSLSVAPLRSVLSAGLPDTLLTATSPRPAASADCHPDSPTVEVVKEGDKVVRLIVVCSCGERVEIDCLYPAGG